MWCTRERKEWRGLHELRVENREPRAEKRKVVLSYTKEAFAFGYRYEGLQRCGVSVSSVSCLRSNYTLMSVCLGGLNTRGGEEQRSRVGAVRQGLGYLWSFKVSGVRAFG